MDFLEHDLKTLLDDMREPFLPSEIKTLLLQFVSGLDFLHSQWIMHRDLKTSNLLMNNRGELKIADFGMARYYGDPPPKLTQLVVTLWYRSPELLLGAETYGTEIDMWSVGCIFGELLTKEPLLQGKNEVDQVSKVHTHAYIPTTLLQHLIFIPDIRPNRPPNTPNLARFPLPPKRKVSPSPILSINTIIDITPARQIPIPHKRRSAAPLLAPRIESNVAALRCGMPRAPIFP